MFRFGSLYRTHTLNGIPRTLSSVLAPSGGALSPWAAYPSDEDVDIFDVVDDVEGLDEISDEALCNSNEDEDNGGAEETDNLELDEVELPFEMVLFVTGIVFAAAAKFEASSTTVYK